MSFSIKYTHGKVTYNSVPLERAVNKKLLLNDETLIKIYITLKRYYDKYTPKAQGDLAAGATPTAEGLKYYQDYAHYQYFGLLMVDPQTGSAWAEKDAKKVYTARPLQYQSAEATAFWDKTAWERDGDEMAKEVQAILAQRAKELLGGKA